MKRNYEEEVDILLNQAKQSFPSHTGNRLLVEVNFSLSRLRNYFHDFKLKDTSNSYIVGGNEYIFVRTRQMKTTIL